MQHVRLITWCSSCVSGMHLPFFAASATGLFAQRGLEVEFVACPTNLTTAEAVAGGHADFALTSVAYLLAAQTAAAGRLPVRFIATAHQRNPIVAVVRQDSDLSRPADLPGARTARWSMPGYAQEYAGALDYMGLGAPALVDTPGDLDPAMGSGDIDVIPVWIDDTTRARLRGMTLHHDGADFGIRAIPLDIPIYSTGLVAADRLPSEVTCQMRDALVAGTSTSARSRSRDWTPSDAISRASPRSTPASTGPCSSPTPSTACPRGTWMPSAGRRRSPTRPRPTAYRRSPESSSTAPSFSRPRPSTAASNHELSGLCGDGLGACSGASGDVVPRGDRVVVGAAAPQVGDGQGDLRADV